MNTEDKELLLKDLCARLSYGIKVQCKTYPNPLEADGIMGEYIYHKPYYVGGTLEISRHHIDDIKIFLRPMSSMTKEETKVYQSLQDTACSYHYEFGYIVDEFLYFDNYASLDYLNSIHVDYRGLISMGLALEAPEGMYV